ncbi:MAG: hypothetical protein ACRD8Z_23115 [Nitrososphaeraceae archaeon]
MEPKSVHLLLGEKSIIVRIELFGGVMTEKTLTGENCYRKLLEFIRRIDTTDSLHAEIDLE